MAVEIQLTPYVLWDSVYHQAPNSDIPHLRIVRTSEDSLAFEQKCTDALGEISWQMTSNADFIVYAAIQALLRSADVAIEAHLLGTWSV